MKWMMILGGVLLFFAGVCAVLLCVLRRRLNPLGPSGTISDSEASQLVDSVFLMSREDIDRRLRSLAKKPFKSVYISAMCYSPSPPTERVDYTCPKCGFRTVWTGAQADIIESELFSCRRLVTGINALTPVRFTLLERGYCHNCSQSQGRSLAIEVLHIDGHTHIFPSVTYRDLAALEALFAGNLYYNYTPLKDRIPRLREILQV